MSRANRLRMRRGTVLVQNDLPVGCRPPAPARGDGRAHQAAFASFAFSCAKAQSSQGVRASRSDCFDGRAAPDAQARRRIAIGADVEGDALLLERGGDALGDLRHGLGTLRDHIGIGDDEADAGVGGRRRNLGEVGDPGVLRDPVVDDLRVGIGLGDERVQAADATSPIRARRCNPRRTSMDGVLMVSPSKMPSMSLPPLVMRKIFGSGQAGL